MLRKFMSRLHKSKKKIDYGSIVGKIVTVRHVEGRNEKIWKSD